MERILQRYPPCCSWLIHICPHLLDKQVHRCVRKELVLNCWMDITMVFWKYMHGLLFWFYDLCMIDVLFLEFMQWLVCWFDNVRRDQFVLLPVYQCVLWRTGDCVWHRFMYVVTSSLMFDLLITKGVHNLGKRSMSWFIAVTLRLFIDWSTCWIYPYLLDDIVWWM